MHILHLTRDFPTGTTTLGGISTALGGLVTALRAIDIDSSILSFDGWRPKGKGDPGPTPAPTMALGHPVLRLSHPAHLPEASAFAQLQAPQIIHVHHDMLWPFGQDLARTLGLPAVVTIHVAQGIQNEIRGISEKTLSLQAQVDAIAQADAILAPSPAVETWLKAAYPGAASRVSLTPFGLHDTPALQHQRRPPPPSATPLLLYVGRFSDIKGSDVLMDAALRLLTAHPTLRIHLAGGAPMSRRIEKRWRKRWVNNAPGEIQGRLTFLGWLDQKALEDAYAGATLLVSPSRYETFGFTVLEALFRGLPVIASDVGGLRWLIRDGETGVLVPPGDPRALGDAILKALEMPNQLQAMAARGREDARERFEWGRVIATHGALYRRLCNGGL